jgi:hypothetical protein
MESAMRQAKIVRAFILTSPMELYTDATTCPWRDLPDRCLCFKVS